MTLRELLEYLQTIPEDQLDEGELWIDNRDGTSREAVKIWPLNKREYSQDVLIE